MSDEVDLLAALTGSSALGSFPDSLHDRLDRALAAAWKLSTGLNINVPALGGTPGPYRGTGTVWDAAYDQTAARYGGPRARTLADKAQLLECLVRGIDGRRAGAGGEAAPTGPASWKPLPVVSRALAEGDTSSFQNTAPQWTQNGMHILMPAKGKDSAAVNPPKSGENIQRCEITVAGQGGITGGRRVFRFVYELGAGFPFDAHVWQVAMQLKGDGSGSPPLSLEIRDGSWCLTWHQLPTTPVGDPVVIGPAKPGVHDLVIDVTFSTAASSSPVSAWLNGKQTVNAVKVGATLYAGKANRVKCGLYRSASIGRTADLTLRGFAAGPTLASVT